MKKTNRLSRVVTFRYRKVIKMELINKLYEMAEEEVSDAEKYIRCAIREKDKHPPIGEVFSRLSADEIGHMNSLLEQAKTVSALHASEIDDAASAVLAYRGEKIREQAAEVRIMQGVYKTS